MSEEDRYKKKTFTSGRRSWIINKRAKHQGVKLEIKKKKISYNGANYWVRMAKDGELYIYAIMKGAVP